MLATLVMYFYLEYLVGQSFFLLSRPDGDEKTSLELVETYKNCFDFSLKINIVVLLFVNKTAGCFDPRIKKSTYVNEYCTFSH